MQKRIIDGIFSLEKVMIGIGLEVSVGIIKIIMRDCQDTVYSQDCH